MKLALAFFAGILVQIAALSFALASENKTTCKVVTTDIGTIYGKGNSQLDAYEDAAIQCYDRRAQLYRMKKGGSVDEDTGLVMIDMCTNISCS